MHRRPTIAVTVLLGVVVLGCGGGPTTVAPGTPPAVAVPVAEAEPSLPAVCSDNCQLLMEHDVRELSDGAYCELCASDRCAGWPADELSCERVDYLRNCMYARLGYTFDKADEWREVFDDEDWYEPRRDFRWSDVSRLQVRNANWLKDKADRRDCVR